MAGLEGSVDVPGFGSVPKRRALTVGLAAFAGILALYWYRQHHAAAAAPGSSAGTVTDPAGNTCSALNPATGFCPGSAEDQAALTGASGGLSAAGGGGGPYDTSGLGVGLQGAYYGSGGAVQSTAPGPGGFADNAEWAQYVENYLVGTLNGDPSAIGNAIGKYLTGQPVTTDQVAVITEAIAYAGQPPQAGPGGDPPGINTTAGSTGSASSSAGGSSWPGGSSSAGGGGSSSAAGPISNLQAYNVTKSGFSARWNPARGATGGYAAILTELNGTRVGGVRHVTGTSVSYSGLHPGWTYNLGLQGLPGGPGDNIHVPLPSK